MMKTSYKAFLLLSALTLGSGCSLMLPDRTYIGQMEGEEQGAFFSAGTDFPVVSGDTGEVRLSRQELLNRTPPSERASRYSKEAASLSEELAQKEENLTESEANRYANDRKFLQTDSDKLYYLSLGAYERSTYIETKRLDLKEDLERPNLIARHSIHSGEIYLGMDKDEVVQVWGKPARVEIAGNPKNQNERWSFREDGSVKQVYFEGGKVQGWALDL